MTIIGIGSDLCNIERIAHSLDRWGDKFLHRVFTETERAKAASRPHTSAAAEKTVERSFEVQPRQPRNAAIAAGSGTIAR